MNNLKEEIAKIHNFVNAEFDIEDNNQVEAIKEGLSLEKIDTLDKMLNDYKKSVSAIRRKEQLRQNAKKYKKIGTNLKLEEFAIFENDAKSKNMNISEYVKSALISFKSVKGVDLPSENETSALKVKYERIQNDLFVLKKDYEAEKAKCQTLTLEKVKLLEDKKKLEQCKKRFLEQEEKLKKEQAKGLGFYLLNSKLGYVVMPFMAFVGVFIVIKNKIFK
jgi:hypothetical protein